MPIFEDLQPGTYYLIREEPGKELTLVSVLMYTDTAVLLRSYLSQAGDVFKNKADEFGEIVEELDGETVAAFEGIYAGEAGEDDL